MASLTGLVETTPDLAAHITRYLGADDILRLTSTNRMFRNFGHVDVRSPSYGHAPITEGQPPENPQMGTERQKALLGKVRDRYARPLRQQRFLSQVQHVRMLKRQGIEPFPPGGRQGMFDFMTSVEEGTRRY